MKLSKTEMKHKIEGLCELKREIDTMYTQLEQVMGIYSESPIMTLMFKLYDSYLTELSLNLNDNHKLIDWFIWENDCGNKKYVAGFDGNMKPIESVDDLIELIIKI